MPPFVAITDSPAGDDISIEKLVLAGVRVEKVDTHAPAALARTLASADGIMCMHIRIDTPLIRSLQRCKAIVRFGTGLDNIDLAAAEAAGIPVLGVHDYCTQEVADHTMALLLAWNRKIVEYHLFVLGKRWNEREQTTGNWGCGPLLRLSGRTLGLVGFGHIGQAVARRALAFGLKVLVNTRHPDLDLARRIGVEPVSLEDLLARSDFVSLHVPSTPQTRHIINEQSIRMMKRGAVLINTARGQLVDEAALGEALESGMLAGALLDVYERAPLPVDHPFRRLGNAILTPHVAFYTEESVSDLRRLAAEALLRHLL